MELEKQKAKTEWYSGRNNFESQVSLEEEMKTVLKVKLLISARN